MVIYRSLLQSSANYIYWESSLLVHSPFLDYENDSDNETDESDENDSEDDYNDDPENDADMHETSDSKVRRT